METAPYEVFPQKPRAQERYRNVTHSRPLSDYGKMVEVAKMHVGFLGLGIMGEAMARNLLKSGLFASVTVWNRTLAKCATLVSEGVLCAETPRAVVDACDVTFAMLADPDAALAAVFGENGVLSAMASGKG